MSLTNTAEVIPLSTWTPRNMITSDGYGCHLVREHGLEKAIPMWIQAGIEEDATDEISRQWDLLSKEIDTTCKQYAKKRVAPSYRDELLEHLAVESAFFADLKSRRYPADLLELALDRIQNHETSFSGLTELWKERFSDTSNEDVPPARKRLFISGNELLSQEIEILKLVGKVIARNSTGQLFGPSGDGKSFVMVDMGLSVVTGTIWNGHQCEQGIVIYFAGEGHGGITRRIRAWWQSHGQPNIDDFHVSRSTITFDAIGILQVIAEVREIEAATGRKVALIIIDTLARHLQGDENSAQDASKFIQQVDGLRDTFPGSSAIFVNHTGNDAEKLGRSRGSSATKAACDFEIQCLKGLLTFTKMKDAEAPEPMEFKLVPVQIGTDEAGEPITSCIVHYGERSAKHKAESLTPYEQTVMDLIREEPGVLIGDLREGFYIKRRETYPDAKPGTLKKAFDRSIEALTRKKIISMTGHSVTEGHKTHGGHVPVMSPAEMGDMGDIILKDVPMSLPATPCHWQEKEKEDLPF